MLARLFSKRNLIILLIILMITIVLVYLANWAIENASKDKTFSSPTEVPTHKTGLLLGTAAQLRGGYDNPYYVARIEATVALFKAGKIEKLIISGDNSKADYDEPSTMRRDLINAGVDSSKIYLDYAGFRTLDSVVRAKKVFGQDSVVIISQRFHNERAIYLAKQEGVNAIGFNASEVEGRAGLKTNIREYFARVKVFVDLLFGVDPHFLGEKVDMNEAPVIANMGI